MPPGSKPTPEQILHEQKCSEKILDLYSPSFFLTMGAAFCVYLGTWGALKGRTYKVRDRAPFLASYLTIFSIGTYRFDVSVFFQIITKLI